MSLSQNSKDLYSSDNNNNKTLFFLQISFLHNMTETESAAHPTNSKNRSGITEMRRRVFVMLLKLQRAISRSGVNRNDPLSQFQKYFFHTQNPLNYSLQVSATDQLP